MDFIILEWLSDERKLIIVRLPFSESNEKFAKSLIKKLVIFANIVNLTLFGTLEILAHSFKLKLTRNTTTALFMKLFACVVKTMSVNP